MCDLLTSKIPYGIIFNQSVESVTDAPDTPEHVTVEMENNRMGGRVRTTQTPYGVKGNSTHHT